MKTLVLYFLVALYISAQAQPTITSFTPTSGPVSTTVTITGTNFNTTPANNIIFFGATKAAVTASTTTQLTVTVPTGATYAPITVLNATTNLLAYSMSNFTPTFTPNKGSITVTDFEPKVDFTTGSNPLSVSIGDLDGDGKADLAVANTASNTLSVFRNTSTGTGNISYAAKVDYPTAGDPQSVAIGDLDGDGKPDVAVANFIGSSVSVFRNTSTGVGNISYAAKIDFTTATPTRSVAIGDLDGDGKADLAVANDVGNSVSILRNTSTGPGNISYAAKVDFTTGASSSPRSVSIGDLDGDGKADLAVASFGSNSVSVFRNTSTGTGSISYAIKVDYTAGTSPISVSIGDLDSDGNPDMAVLNLNSNTVSVFRSVSTGPGNIDFAAKVDFATGTATRSISIGDLDGDGKPDLAVTNHSNNTVSVFRNTSTGAGNIGYAAKIDLTTGTNSISVSIGDLDGDGKPDMAVANAGSNSVSVIRNNPVFLIPTITNFTPALGPISTSVTITGTNFSGTPANNTVQFNGTTAVVTASTSTSITTTVPSGATTGTITVTVAGNTAISATNFTVTASAVITINPQPTSIAVCEGAIANFSLTASGTTNLTYQWQKFNGTAFANISNTGGYSGTTTSKLSINTTGNFGAGDYRCSVSGDLVTSVFSQTAALTFTTNTTLAEITVNGNNLTASLGDTYQWFHNGNAVSGATNQSYDYNVLEYGVYSVEVTKNGCTSTSTDFVYLITGVEHANSGLKLFPNPVEEILAIEFQPPYSITIINTNGRTVSKQNSNTRASSIDVRTWANGVYVLQLSNEKGTTYHRIVKK